MAIEGSRWAEAYGVVGAVVAAVLFLGFFLSHTLRVWRHPQLPGRAGWPTLGSLPSLGPLPHISLYELSKIYGPLMYIRLGSVRMVVVTSPQLAGEVLKTQDQIWASRPGMIASAKLFYGGIDVGFSAYGPHWCYARKVLHGETLHIYTPQAVSAVIEQVEILLADTKSVKKLRRLLTELLILRDAQEQIKPPVGPNTTVVMQ